jgi:integral membrane protein
MTESSTLKRFILIGKLEAYSFISLLLIAMPVKYIFGEEILVKYVGWLHGLLFILYFIGLFAAYFKMRWSFKLLVLGAIASFVPFGPFWFHKQIKS